MRAQFLLRPVLTLMFVAAFATAAPANEVLDQFDRGLAARGEEAYNILLPLAEKGHAGAQHVVGEMLMNQAMTWYRFPPKAPPAWVIRLGDGKTVYNLGLRWIERAAEQNLIVAQYRLGERLIEVQEVYGLNADGKFDPSKTEEIRWDFSRALYWFRRAAMQGDLKAMDRLIQLDRPVLERWENGAYVWGPTKWRTKGSDPVEAIMYSILYYAYRIREHGGGRCEGFHCAVPDDATQKQVSEAVRRALDWEPMFPNWQMIPVHLMPLNPPSGIVYEK